MLFLTVTFSWFTPEHQEGHYILINLVASYSVTRNILKLTFLRSIYKEITTKNSAQCVEQAIWGFSVRENTETEEPKNQDNHFPSCFCLSDSRISFSLPSKVLQTLRIKYSIFCGPSEKAIFSG